MFYYSTNSVTERANFKQATIQGQAPDRGLYFPEAIPVLPADLIKNCDRLFKEEIALEVIKPYVGDTIPVADLEKIVADTVNFDFPLVQVTDSISSLELFHGPTLAFKDVGARFMSRCLGHFVQDGKRKVTVLVATSGDTGGAVAAGFHKVEGVDVVILYPSGKVSAVQELQLTTWGDNITALEVEGSFDDCQQMVKDAFTDVALNEKLFLTSANSINVARWLPQQFYYFYAWQQWADKETPPVISVPSGNFGNICAGLLAHRSGLPVTKFIAACNANDAVPQYIAEGAYKSKQAVYTLSNAMDVGNPSNFVRLLEIFSHQDDQVRNVVSSYSISDNETIAAIKQVKLEHDYLLDPHGAVGYTALERYLQSHPNDKGYFLETAHPIKFETSIATGYQPQMPAAVQQLFKKEKASLKIKASPEELKDFLMSR